MTSHDRLKLRFATPPYRKKRKKKEKNWSTYFIDTQAVSWFSSNVREWSRGLLAGDTSHLDINWTRRTSSQVGVYVLTRVLQSTFFHITVLSIIASFFYQLVPCWGDTDHKEQIWHATRSRQLDNIPILRPLRPFVSGMMTSTVVEPSKVLKSFQPEMQKRDETYIDPNLVTVCPRNASPTKALTLVDQEELRCDKARASYSISCQLESRFSNRTDD